MNSPAFEAIEFESEGATLRGRFYLPTSVPAPLPTVIMAHGFSATIVMTTDKYAESFVDAGLAVLLYDHRNLGSSDGEPRGEINAWVQARGYRDALNFALTLPSVDATRIALWGDSFSASVALVVSGVDERVAAVVAQVPATGRDPAPADPDGGLYEALRETLLNGDVSGGPEDTIGPLPVVSADQIHAPSLLLPIQAFRWFVDYGGRFGTGWDNRATRVIPQTPAPFHAGLVAPHIRCPALLQIAWDDEMIGANPAVAHAIAAAIAGPTQVVEIGGGHFGLLYHPSALFEDASRTQIAFLLQQFRVPD